MKNILLNNKVWIITTALLSVLIIFGIVGYGYFTRDDSNISSENKTSTSDSPVVTDSQKKQDNEKVEEKVEESDTKKASVATEKKEVSITPGGEFEIEKNINWVIDLDGDGQDELVCFKEEDCDNERYLCIYINNELMSRNAEMFDEMNTDLQEYDNINYCKYRVSIGDICSNDNMYEIFTYCGVIYENPDDRVETRDAYVLENNSLNNINLLEGEYNCDDTPGLTKVEMYTINILEAYLNKSYQYNTTTHEFEEVDTDIYDINYVKECTENEDGSVPLYKDLMVYENVDDENANIKVKAQDVVFKKIYLVDSKINDNNNISANEVWYYIEAKDGTSGWIHVKNDLNSKQAKENSNMSKSCYYNSFSINGDLSERYFRCDVIN